ncbi:Histidinol phosphatase [Candidatus Hodgkinia cicadicola]|uniref:Histidinol phosphatase n=1 Tax=Candidatus Hodgkinia cicadicola TaxID=573658 RepID=A0ABX4MJ92_9HYPH|nr:Histidinol phosphatase [Candidatus Hodgkinia cicadicola]PIM96014.1 Histidinol phosphatase [Candidatus Hodgkinia cicadicola]
MLIVNRIHKFYFKLINSVLDNIRCHTKDLSIFNRIDFVSKGKGFNPVTIYDKVIENDLIELADLITPKIKVYGEEFKVGINNNSMWLIDPIDGTKSFVCGSPIWGTLISLIKNGAFVFGAVDHPMLDERLVAIDGKTFYKDKHHNFITLPNVVDNKKRLNQYIIASSSIGHMTLKKRKAFTRLSKKVQHVIYDYDCYAYTMLAKGYIDAVIECNLNPYDFVQLVPILKGVGCEIYDWKGKDTCYSTNIIASKPGKIRRHIVKTLSKSY